MAREKMKSVLSLDHLQVGPVDQNGLAEFVPMVSAVRVANMSKLVAEHHERQFGRVGWERLAAKLGEEVGELQGAIVRDMERRDGRAWKNEMFLEMQDVLTVLHVMAARMDDEVSKMSDDAGKYFLTREFKNIRKVE